MNFPPRVRPARDFARNPNGISRQQILAAVWEYDFEGESNVVDVYVRYLRQKLEELGICQPFTTIRGSGYRFDPPSTGDEDDGKHQ